MEDISKPETLYIGIDDSNHAGQNKKGEIILATFSRDPDDGKAQRQNVRRDAHKASLWFNQKNHDYRFTILSDEDSRHRGYNVVLIAPLLIRAYLEEHCPDIDKLFIACDGPIRRNQKIYIEEHFSEYRVQAEGFIKKTHHNGKLQSSCIAPYVVTAADVWAHWLYSTQPLEALATSPKMVAISSVTVEECNQKIRAALHN